MGMVALEKVESPEDVDALHGFIQQHQEHTGSTTAQRLLDDYGTAVTKFVKVRDCVYRIWGVVWSLVSMCCCQFFVW